MPPAAGPYRIRSWNNEHLPYHLDYWLRAASSMNAPRFVYIDGFAGSGFQANNKDNAAIIAYKAALRHQNLALKCPEIYILMIEADSNKCESLLLRLEKVKEDTKRFRNADKVKVMVIHAEFAPALDWILSEKFSFFESTPSAVFKPTSERFITRTTPTLLFADLPGQNYTIPVPLMQKFTRTAGMGGMLIADFTERVLYNPIGGSIIFVDGVKSELWQVVVLIGEDDYLQTYIMLF